MTRARGDEPLLGKQVRSGARTRWIHSASLSARRVSMSTHCVSLPVRGAGLLPRRVSLSARGPSLSARPTRLAARPTRMLTPCASRSAPAPSMAVGDVNTATRGATNRIPRISVLSDAESAGQGRVFGTAVRAAESPSARAAPYEVSRICLTAVAGLPWARTFGGTSLMTTLPAAMTVPRPTVTPGPRKAPLLEHIFVVDASNA